MLYSVLGVKIDLTCSKIMYIQMEVKDIIIIILTVTTIIMKMKKDKNILLDGVPESRNSFSC